MQPNVVNLRIGEVTEHLRLWRKETRDEIAVLLGMSTKSLGRRISGSAPWEAWEVKTIADHFGIPVERFYEGADGFFLTGSAVTPSEEQQHPSRRSWVDRVA